jgi:hypothetical protein
VGFGTLIYTSLTYPGSTDPSGSCTAASPLAANTPANITGTLNLAAVPSGTFSVVLNFTDATSNWLYCLNASFTAP